MKSTLEQLKNLFVFAQYKNGELGLAMSKIWRGNTKNQDCHSTASLAMTVKIGGVYD